MNIIEQFIKEKTYKWGLPSDIHRALRAFADYLTANGYEIVKKECKHENGSEWNENDDSVCKDCGNLVLICPETPTLPEKLENYGNKEEYAIVSAINQILDYLKAKK